MIEFSKQSTSWKIILEPRTDNVIVSKLESFMYVVLSKAENHMPLWELVGTTECTRSVRKVSDRIFLCEHLMDYNLARLHEPTLNLSAHA